MSEVGEAGPAESLKNPPLPRHRAFGAWAVHCHQQPITVEGDPYDHRMSPPHPIPSC